MTHIECPQCGKTHHSMISNPLCPDCYTSTESGNPSVDLLLTVSFDGSDFLVQVNDWFSERGCAPDLLDALQHVLEIGEDGFNQLDELLRNQYHKDANTPESFPFDTFEQAAASIDTVPTHYILIINPSKVDTRGLIRREGIYGLGFQTVMMTPRQSPLEFVSPERYEMIMEQFGGQQMVVYVIRRE